MKNKFSLTILTCSLSLVFPLTVNAEAVIANENNGDKLIEVNGVVDGVFATQAHTAELKGPYISINNTHQNNKYAVQANRLGSDSASSKILIGTEDTISVDIKTHLGDAVLSNDSQIEIFGKEISIQGKSNGLKANSALGEGSQIIVGSNTTNSVHISSIGDGNENSYGIYAQGKESEVVVLGQKIEISSSQSVDSQKLADGIDVYSGAKVALGSKDTQTLSINGLVGAFVKDIGSSLSIEGQTISINSEEVGVWAQNGSQEEIKPENGAVISIQGSNTSIDAPQGIVAYSNSNVNIDSNLEINSSEAAVVARGNSLVNVNVDGDKTTVLNGDVVFMSTSPDGQSGNLINASVNIGLNNDNSVWNGRAYQTFKDDSGQMIEVVDLDNGNDYYGNVTEFQVNMSDGAVWNVTGDSFINDIKVADGASVNMQADAKVLNVDVMNVDNATVSMQGGSDQKVSVNTLSSKAGTLRMNASTEDGKTVQTGQFEVLKSVEDGSDLGIMLTGITSDDIEDAQAAMDSVKNSVVAKGAIIEKTIAEGDVNGAITETTSADGTRSTVQTAENTKLVSMKGVNAAALVAWRDEVAYTNQRMEYLRDGGNTYGAWAQVYGGESSYDDGSVDLKTTTVQVGADTAIGDWVAGATFSYMNGDADMHNGSVDTDAYTLSLYASRMFDSGLFVNGLARYGRLSTDATAGNMDGSYDNNAFSIGGNIGYRFTFAEQAFVEPSFGLQYAYVMGDDYTASNGVKVEQDDFDALIASLGARIGFNFAKDAGKIYARASVNHDFMGEIDGTAGNGKAVQDMYVDLGGTWVTYGLGTQFNITDNLSVWGNLDRTTGGEVSTNYMMNAGVRYVF